MSSNSASWIAKVNPSPGTLVINVVSVLAAAVLVAVTEWRCIPPTKNPGVGALKRPCESVISPAI
jgi:hypothetical protein